MLNIKKEKKIFSLLISEFHNESLNDFSLNSILKKKSINEEDFYYCFPNKTKSLCIFFLKNLQLKLENKTKKVIKSEKSISKRVKFILIQLIMLLEEDKATSLYFLNYMSRKLFFLKSISLNFSNTVWYLLDDKSVDFNFYTKRILLSKILINSVLYWRGSNDHKKTEIFINQQIDLLGKFGYYKSNFKALISKLTPKNFLTKFDFLH
ncbi:MAG: hypothetical protein CMJ06_05465 [Pelagibacterales bacterium]|nr:hypothetical protein [Pelagibacterales bacterium]OUU61375.1 MAG: hypothetical protein CBC22_07530 [Alphaproteobacteria bacterium TMED62]|tara:strand:+ start:7043 stop:7666 length:624 start_codon:yes stop_codon:yes gene_type:complete